MGRCAQSSTRIGPWEEPADGRIDHHGTQHRRHEVPGGFAGHCTTDISFQELGALPRALSNTARMVSGIEDITRNSIKALYRSFTVQINRTGILLAAPMLDPHSCG